MASLTPIEEKAFKLLFEEHLPATRVAAKLEAQGGKMSVDKLRAFKRSVYEMMMGEERQERMSELMLDSVDRVKFEFEDLVSKTKALLTKFEAEGRTFEQIIVLRELKEQIVIALKKLGEFKTGMLNVKAKNINILSATNFADSFKKLQRKWFAEMGASVEGGKLVFNKPSPEMLDDFYRFEAEELREAKRIPNESRADN